MKFLNKKHMIISITIAVALLVAIVFYLIMKSVNDYYFPKNNINTEIKASDSTSLDTQFFIHYKMGGSITGPTFYVNVCSSCGEGKTPTIEYYEVSPDGTKKNEMKRSLTKNEFEDIQKVGADAYYVGLQTAGGTNEVVFPDSGYYHINILLDMKGSSLNCPSPHGSPVNKCQKQAEILRLKFSKILGVEIR